jgi:hypothetical protein
MFSLNKIQEWLSGSVAVITGIGFTANNIIPFIKVGGEIILLLMAITAGRYFNKSRKVAYEMEMMKKEELQAQIDRQIEIYEQGSFDDAPKNKDKVVD